MVQQRFDMRPMLEQRIGELDTRRRELAAEQERIERELEQVSQDIRKATEYLQVERRLHGEKESLTVAVIGGQLASMGLRDAIALLRRENPEVTKAEVRHRLEAISFDFKGKRPGNAINMAWVALNAHALREGGNGR